MWVIFGVITLVFILAFGPWVGADLSGNAPFAARVNGRVISTAQFQASYSNRFRTMQMFRKDYNVDAAKKENLKQQVIDALIDQELLAQQAEKYQLTVTDQKVAQIIKERFFGPDTPFSRDQYKRVVNGIYQTTEVRFENQIRREQMATEMEEVIRNSEQISEDEMRKAYENQNNRADLDVVRIDPNYFKVPAPTAAALKTWSDNNKDAVQKHYETFNSKYNQPKKVRARHILVKTAEKADAPTLTAAKSKIEAALKRVTEGKEDFALVAKEVSDDGSASKGGDLGLFGPGQMVKPFEEAAYALKAGEVSGVVKSRFGFHVIKVEEVQEASVKKLEDVRTEIADELYKDATRNEQAQKMASNAIEQLNTGVAMADLKLPDLYNKAAPDAPEKPADPFAPRIENTGFFAQNARYIPRVGISEDLVKAAFDLSKEKAVGPKAYEVNKRLFVIKLKDQEKADLSKLSDEKGELKGQLLRERQSGAVQTFVKQLRDKAKVSVNIAVIQYPATS
jgi:peptidyl-prolyl cis-trans isomerase D